MTDTPLCAENSAQKAVVSQNANASSPSKKPQATPIRTKGDESLSSFTSEDEVN